MGVVKVALIVGLTAIVVSNLHRFTDPTLPPVFGGTCDKDFQAVCDAFRSNVESGLEPGGSFAAYHEGRNVVNVWGGYADLEALRPWDETTTALGFSCTKGVAAIVVAKMVQDGVLDYKKLVSDYWPDFGQAGKDNVTVEMLISHQAGLPYLDEPISVLDLHRDPDAIGRSLAAQKPAWPPGTKFGYHSLTFGLYVDQLVRRADPKGRSTDQIFLEDIAGPHDIDFLMNVPRDQFYRAARLYPRSKPQLLIDAFKFRRYLKPIADIIFYPNSWMARSVIPIKEFAAATSSLNSPYIREVAISSISGSGTAKGLAKVYGILGNGGHHDNQELLSSATIERLSTPVVTGQDVVFITGEKSAIGPGTLFTKNPKQNHVFDTGDNLTVGGSIGPWGLSQRPESACVSLRLFQFCCVVDCAGSPEQCQRNSPDFHQPQIPVWIEGVNG